MNTLRLGRIAKRWIDVAAYGGIGGLLWIVFGPEITEYLKSAVERLASLRWQVVVLVIAALVLLGARIVGGRVLGLLGLKNALVYPSLWMGAAVGAGLVMFAGDQVTPLLSLLACVVVVLGASLLANPIQSFWAKRKSHSSGELEPSVTDGDWRHWVAGNDDPISSPEQDAFGHNATALRIATRIKNGLSSECPTIALIGPVGSGKSSILRLVNHHLESESSFSARVSLVAVSVLPFETAESAVRGIIRSLIQELSRHVSVIGLAGISEVYLSAIEDKGGILRLLSHLLRGSGTPAETLKVIEDIAVAIDWQIVLCVEDIERLGTTLVTRNKRSEADVDDELSPIRSLLYLLDQQKRISVIVADGTLENRFDVDKVARYIERPPSIGFEHAWRVLSGFRDHCLLREKPSIWDAASPSHRDRLKVGNLDLQAAILQYRYDPQEPTLHESITMLIETPRMFRMFIRDCYDTWSSLRGEIDFDDVLVITTLKIARPSVFALVNDRVSDFRQGFLSHPSNRNNDEAVVRPAAEELKALLGREKDLAMANAITELIEFVFPDFQKQGQSGRQPYRHITANPQGLAINVNGDYWERFAASVPIDLEESDQQLMQEINSWKERTANALIARMIDPKRGHRIECYAEHFDPDEIIRLLEETTDALKDVPATYFTDRDEAMPILWVWRMALVRRPDARRLSMAISDGIAKVIDINLPLANTLFNVFCEREGADQIYLLPEENRDNVRNNLTLLMVSRFKNDDGSKLVDALNDGSPYLLGWLIWTLARINHDNYDGIPFDGWNDFAKIMVRAAKQNPDKMLPQFVGFLTNSIDARGDDGRRLTYRHSEFDAERTIRLFGEEAPGLAALFREHESPGNLEAQPSESYNAIRSFVIANPDWPHSDECNDDEPDADAESQHDNDEAQE